MQTTSTVAPRNVRLMSWPVSSRTPDLLGTFRGEVAEEDLDADRGARIKSLRDGLGLTQPEAVDLLTEIGGEGPTGPYVTARQYQRWEQGATLTRRRAKVLAEAFGTSTQFIFTGEGERRLASKDPVTVDRLDGELADRISTIETTLQGITSLLEAARSERDHIRELLARQDGILQRIEDAIRSEEDVRQLLDESVETAERASRETVRLLAELQAAPPRPAAARKTTAK